MDHKKTKCNNYGCKLPLSKRSDWRCDKHQEQHQKELTEIAGTAKWAAENPELVD